MEKYHHILRNAADELNQNGSLFTCVEMQRILSIKRPIKIIIEDLLNSSNGISHFNTNANKIIIPFFSNPEMKRRKTLKPIFGSGHWSCVLLDYEAEKIKYMDSLGYPNAYFDFDILKQKSIEIMAAIDYFHEFKLKKIPTEMEFIPTTGMFLITVLCSFRRLCLYLK